jgi:large subunit ribosomal protein L27
MAHVKGSGSVNQHAQGHRDGRRHGLKKFGGEKVIAGNIIVRQKGAKYKAGKNVNMGRDYTISSLIVGIVAYSKKFGKTVVNVMAGV